MPRRKTAAHASPNLPARVGERVRAARQSRDETVAELAGRAGLSRRFLTDVELGKANISLQGLAKLAQALALEPATLLAPDELLASIERFAKTAPRAESSAQRFALVGLRGAGKTTLGRAVADRLKLRFVELDQLVEEAAGMPLGDLFNLHGAAYYRQVEREALTKLLDDARPMVVAASGGIVAAADTYDLLRRSFVTIWLKATPADHWNRVVEQGDSRPMHNQPSAMARLREILDERAPAYGLAQHTIDTSALGLRASTAELERIVRAARNGDAR